MSSASKNITVWKWKPFSKKLIQFVYIFGDLFIYWKTHAKQDTIVFPLTGILLI